MIKKFFSIVLVLTLTMLSSTMVFANTAKQVNLIEYETTTFNIEKISQENLNEEYPAPKGVGVIAILIGGALAGYLIDGVIIYVTGYSGPELTAQAIAQLIQYIQTFTNTIMAFFNSSGTTFIGGRSSGGGSFIMPFIMPLLKFSYGV